MYTVIIEDPAPLKVNYGALKNKLMKETFCRKIKSDPHLFPKFKTCFLPFCYSCKGTES